MIEDYELSGLLDGELDPERERAVNNAIETDPIIRERYTALVSAHNILSKYAIDVQAHSNYPNEQLFEWRYINIVVAIVFVVAGLKLVNFGNAQLILNFVELLAMAVVIYVVTRLSRFETSN